ncbi:TspO/MBR family protein [Streptomyces sp. NPDC012825]|uniref:TspO/MBR family protein n=1 Tax=Streptomyces sp. NPDC012825 TaxID=3364851 RepID=UPI0036A05A49
MAQSLQAHPLPPRGPLPGDHPHSHRPAGGEHQDDGHPGVRAYEVHHCRDHTPRDDQSTKGQQERRPPWAPLGWLFGPVWTVLYGTIAVAAWLVLRNPQGPTRTAMTWWSAQLLLNLTWTPLFFAADEYGLAFLDICLLLAALLTTMVLFARHRRAAAILLVPYGLWVTFAAALNLAIWLSNT